jgi:hypothetical protein
MILWTVGFAFGAILFNELCAVQIDDNIIVKQTLHSFKKSEKLEINLPSAILSDVKVLKQMKHTG